MSEDKYLFNVFKNDLCIMDHCYRINNTYFYYILI